MRCLGPSARGALHMPQPSTTSPYADKLAIEISGALSCSVRLVEKVDKLFEVDLIVALHACNFDHH
jgi:hypothetical protein